MFKPKIWLRLGALAVASSATALPKPILATQTQEDSKEAARQPGTAGPVLAQSGRRGAGSRGSLQALRHADDRQGRHPAVLTSGGPDTAFCWTGIGAPKNTPAAIVDKLNTEI